MKKLGSVGNGSLASVLIGIFFFLFLLSCSKGQIYSSDLVVNGKEIEF